MGVSSKDVYDVCRVSSRLFVFHPEFRRINFYAQQLRALSLVSEIAEQGHLPPGGRNVLVAGAGIAGLMTAAALVTVGATVTVVDPSPPLDKYYPAGHRELHPNIILWPFQRPRAITDLPFLNWGCGLTSDVVKDIRLQWQEDFADSVTVEKATVSAVEDLGDTVKVEYTGGASSRHDLAILALGFGEERDIQLVGCPGYWDKDAARRHPTIVSGSGDGGLIDAAYQIFDSDVICVARMIAYSAYDKPLAEDIRKVETEALAVYLAGDKIKARESLNRYYSMVRLEPEEARRLAGLARQGTGPVTLVHEEEHPYGPFASPANKLLVAAAMSILPGRITARKAKISFDAAGHPLETDAGVTTALDPRQLIVRHGAPTVVDGLLSAGQQAAVAAKPKGILSAVIDDAFDRKRFSRSPERKVAPSKKFKGARYHERLQERIKHTLTYVARGRGRFKLRSGIEKEPWMADWEGLDDVRDLKCIFPMKTDGIEIRFGKSGFVGDAV